MPENTEEQELKNRTEQVNSRKESGETVILDGNGQRDDEEALSENVFKIEDLLIKESNNPVVRRLNRLKDYGLTDEMILDTYSELAGNVTKETDAIAVLKVIFDRYVEYISSIPNGIVINPLTGRKDDQASYEQKLEVGILTDPFKGIDMDVKISLDDILNIDRKSLEGFKDYAVEYMILKDMFRNYIPNIGNEDIKNILLKDVDETNFFAGTKELIEKSRSNVEISRYNDNLLYEITKLEYALAKAEGTAAALTYKKQIEEFYAKNPTCKGQVPIVDKNGKIVESERKKFEQFEEDGKILLVTSKFESYYKKTPEERQNLSKVERQDLFCAAFSALKHFKKESGDYKDYVAEAQKILKEFYPGLDFSDVTNKEQQALFAEILKKEFDINGNFPKVTFTEMFQLADDRVGNSLSENLINGKLKLLDDNLKDASIEMMDKNKKQVAMENYFVGSRIQFSKDDFVAYESLYKVLTVDAWLEDKNSALKMRYAGLITMKEEYERKSDNPYIAEKLNEVNQQLKEFTSNYGKIELSPEDRGDFARYRECMLTANIMKFYTKDAINAKNGESYNDLDEKHKKAYIRNTLIGLEYIDSNREFHFSKLTMRRLEQMNTSNKKFITYDKKGNPVIDKELILQEYSAMSDHEYKSFDELLESTKLRKDDYLLEKLETYSKLSPDKFVKLTDKNDIETSISEIEEARAKENVDEKRRFFILKSGVRVTRTENVLKGNKGIHKKIGDEEFLEMYNSRGETLNDSAIDELKIKMMQRKIAKQKLSTKKIVYAQDVRKKPLESRKNSSNSQNEINEEYKNDLWSETNEQGVDESNNGGESTAGGENSGTVREESNTTMALMPKKQNNIINILKTAVVNAFNRLKETILSKKKDEEKQDATIENVDKSAIKGNDPETKDWLKRVVSSETQQKFAREAQQSHDSRKTNATPVPEIDDEEPGR